MSSYAKQRFNGIVVHSDCVHFKGDVPCRPHKEFGVHCDGCTHYEPKDRSVLIIKLGAIGDVIRTTPLLHRVKQEFPTAEIWWLTQTPEIVPSAVHKVLPFTPESVVLLQSTRFDYVFNLDKDPAACAVMKSVKSRKKFGFTLVNGKPSPVNKHAVGKFLTGVFDDLSKQNTKSYPQEIFEICGWKFQGEEYILDVDAEAKWPLSSDGPPVVGLNTGCGGRWTSRKWANERWSELARKLTSSGYRVLLLGGESEHEVNSKIAKETGAEYLGCFPFKQFISLMNRCDVVVTVVTMALHIAIGLKKPVVLINNIFNPNEFELYGRGEIIQPERPCKCFYKPVCTNEEYRCIESVSVQKVFDSVVQAAQVKANGLKRSKV